MKHEINIDDLLCEPELLEEAFEQIATKDDFKTLYSLQKEECSNQLEAVVKLINNNEKMKAGILKYVNNKKNYPEYMAYFCSDSDDMAYVIPHKESNIYVEIHNQQVWLWIEDRVMLSRFPYNSDRYLAAELVVDEYYDTLVCRTSSYMHTYRGLGPEDNGIDAKIAKAYVDYLAEKELLGDE